MSYNITRLSEQLIYIRVTANPTPEDDIAYLQALEQLINEAPQPLYFLVDFRQGITTNITTIRRLAELTQHPNFGHSVAFANEYIKTLYTSLFAKMAHLDVYERLPKNPTQALKMLEDYAPHITEGIDWEKTFS